VGVPVSIDRNAEESVVATLYRADEVPAGFVQIPAGRFPFQGDRANPHSTPVAGHRAEDAFLGRFPVACREYLTFLNDLAETNPVAAAARVPRQAESSGFYWPRGQDGRYAVPTAEWLAGAPPDLRKTARRANQSPEDWREDWPVVGVSWGDAMAYASWFARKSGFLASLPHDLLWEKGARGPEGRFYPWGNEFDDTFANTMQSHDGPPRPCPVDSFPSDESPYGIRGLCGNVVDWCLNDVEGGRRRLVRGGSWLFTGFYLRSSFRRANPPGVIGEFTGFRLCVTPAVPTRPHALLK
jgi:serine/threonine-protein kinase